MATTPQRPIVVGVDGSESALSAVTWGARHASRAGLPLRLVRAFSRPLVRTSNAVGKRTHGLRDDAWTCLDEAKHRAFQVAPELTVTAAAPTSFATTLLLRESEQTSLVVVGPHAVGGLCGRVFGSTGLELAARASSPIVVVRGRPAVQIAANAPVIVGYDESAASELAVAAGFEHAALHGRALVLLHVRRPGSYEPHMCERIIDVAAGGRRRYPNVEVVSRIVTGHPGDVLTDSSRTASLVVVGSRGREGFHDLVMGSVSHALIGHAGSPVEILSPNVVSNRPGAADELAAARTVGA